MPLIPITSLDDPRVAPYRNLKDRDLAREGGRFLAEGHLVVHRLLASSFETESVFLADTRVADNLPLIPAHVPVYVAPPQLVSAVMGFKFHAGVMAVGLRGPSPTIDGVMRSKDEGGRMKDEQSAIRNPQSEIGSPSSFILPPSSLVTWLIAPDIEKSDNLGAVIRIAAGFGCAGVLLGERSCDPFSRQAVRVSMGSALALPIVRSDDLKRDLAILKERHDVQLAATVLADDAEPLEPATRPARVGLLLGNEFHGLADDVVALCDRRVTLPMSLGTDSLNVAVAAGVFLYHFTRIARVTNP
ncbi:MAG TPA: RNA methyltransferase [Tepidisphaeraceae bacterium]|nr:RNA methyltransferase [Tepidisphaeraceae bacterium]